MLDTNEQLQHLHRKLVETIEPYKTLYQRVHETKLGNILSTIMSRREENIAELTTFLSEEGIENDTDAEVGSLSVSFPDDVASTERDILDAYDKAIIPITGEHEKYGFLVDQYEWLKQMVESLAKSTLKDLP